MDREKMYEEYDRLFEELSKQTPGTKEYADTLAVLEKLHKMIIADEGAEQQRINDTMTQDLRQQEIEQKDRESAERAKASRWDSIWGFLGKLVSGILAIGGVLLLGEIKEEQGVVDKDKFSLVRGMFPKG